MARSVQTGIDSSSALARDALAGVVTWLVLTGCAPVSPRDSSHDFGSGAGTGGAAGGAPAAGSGGSTSAATGGMASLGHGAGAGADAGGGPPVTWPPASPGCRAYYEANCDWLARCANDEEYRSQCEAGIDAACAWFGLPGVGVSEDLWFAAAAQILGSDCGTYVYAEFPGGSLEEGAPCATGLQCASGYCEAKLDGCGECTPSPWHEIGESCEPASPYCLGDAACIEGVCTALRQEGETCDQVHTCSMGVRADGQLTCMQGTCIVVSHDGEPCVNDASCGIGDSCTLAGFCVAVELVEPGEVCGTFDDRVIACRDSGCATSGEGSAHCLEFAGLGEDCRKVPGYHRCRGTLTCGSDDICRYEETRGPPACGG